MALTVTHIKTNTITDWTQADLDAQIALGNFPVGTVLADIVLPSDWNDPHTVSGSSETYSSLAISTALSASDTNSVYDNTGASALVVAGLPAASIGLNFTFIITDSDGFQLDAAGSDTIRIGGSITSAGGTMTCTQVGGSVTIYGQSGGWVASSSMMTWIDA